jgi:hypothetical protein
MLFTVVIDTIITDSLTDCGNHTTSIILDDLTIDISAPMSFWREIIIAQMHIMPILTKSFHLIVNLLRDAAMLRESMIYKKEYSHL